MKQNRFPLVIAGALISVGAFSGCSKSNSNSCTLTSFTQDESTPTGVVIGSSTYSSLAQTFYLAASGSSSTISVSDISLRVTKQGTGFSSTTGANTVTLNLYQDATTGTDTSTTGQPEGSIVSGSSAVTVDLISIPSGEGLVKFSFPKAVALNPNQTYWIVVTASYQSGPTSSNNLEWMQYSGSETYSGGIAYAFPFGGSLWQYLGTQTYFEFIVANC